MCAARTGFEVPHFAVDILAVQDDLLIHVDVVLLVPLARQVAAPVALDDGGGVAPLASTRLEVLDRLLRRVLLPHEALALRYVGFLPLYALLAHDGAHFDHVARDPAAEQRL